MKAVRYVERSTKKAGTLHSQNPIIKTLLLGRGITEDEELQKLDTEYDEGIHDPYLLKDMDRATKRIFSALQTGEIIAVFADYDADGVPGGALLTLFFRQIGFKHVVPYIPHRGLEGFGLNNDAIDELKEKGVTLIITVDCGITDVAEVQYAQELGIDVIITDHHIPGDVLPEAHAILNPKQPGCNYPFKELCGTAVAYKLVQAIIKEETLDFPQGHEKWFLDLVGIATLADMVPLVGENRVLARYGLLVLRKGRRLGIRELLLQSKVDYRTLGEEDVTFTIAPRINAAGRMEHPMIAFELLTAQTRSEAAERALELEGINKKRKTLVASIVKEVKKKVKPSDVPVIVVGSTEWKPGILGLIANALVDAFGKSAFVWGREGDGPLKGSVRSDGVTNVYDLMSHLPEGTLMHFGGHERSAGFVVGHDKVDIFREELYKCAEGLDVDDDVLVKMYDTEIFPDDLTDTLFDEVLSLGPYGVGFEKPLFKISEVTVSSAKDFGKAKNHLELSFRRNGSTLVTSIGFFMKKDDFDVELEEGSTITLYGSLEKSFYKRYPEYRIRIEHLE